MADRTLTITLSEEEWDEVYTAVDFLAGGSEIAADACSKLSKVIYPEEEEGETK